MRIWILLTLVMILASGGIAKDHGSVYVNHQTHFHGEGVSGGEAYQDWHATFGSNRCRGQSCSGSPDGNVDQIVISDDDGNSATESSGQNYRVWTSDYSWLQGNDNVCVYFKDGSLNSNTQCNTMPEPNRPPNQPSNPDPAQATGTSPVYTTSPQMSIDVSDPDGGDDLDVDFYQGSTSYDQNLNIYQWAHNQGSHPTTKSGLDEFFDGGSYVTSFTGSGFEDRVDCESEDENCHRFSSDQDYYSTCLTGYIYAPESGTYGFATDSDDASDIYIGSSQYSRDDCDTPPTSDRVVEWYGGHGDQNDWTHNGQIDLSQGYHSVMYRQEEITGGESWEMAWNKPTDSSYTLVPSNRLYHSSGSGSSYIDSHNSVSNGGTATISWNGLNEGSSYDWYARACDPDGECTFSDTFTFEVSSGPLQPDNPNPSDGANLYAPSGEVDLSARYRHTDGAEPGTLTFYNDDGSTISSCQANHNNRCTVTKNVNNGQRYDWYVVADYNGQTATSDTWHFVTNTPPEAPDNPSPSDGADSVNYNSATLSADVEDVDSDSMTVTFSGTSASDSFSQSTTVSGSGTATVTVNNLAKGETYNWDVTAEDEHGASTTSSTWTFTTNYLPTIENPSPTDGAYVSSDQVQLGIDVSDQDGDQTDVRIYDQSGNQIGSGSTSDGSQVRVNAQYTGLSFGNTYDWTVEAEDAYGQTDTTYSFSVIGSGSFRSATGIDYEYSSIIKSSSQSSYFEYEVTNENVNNKELETRLQGADAQFQQYGGTSHTYTLNSGETKTFTIEVTEDTVGKHTVDVVTEDLRLGVQNVDSMPVLIREYPASDVQEVPGLMWLQVLFLAAGATVLYSALL